MKAIWFIAIFAFVFSAGLVVAVFLAVRKFQKELKEKKQIEEDLRKQGYPPWAEILPGFPLVHNRL